jgi:hypothetical protein
MQKGHYALRLRTMKKGHYSLRLRGSALWPSAAAPRAYNRTRRTQHPSSLGNVYRARALTGGEIVPDGPVGALEIPHESWRVERI